MSQGLEKDPDKEEVRRLLDLLRTLMRMLGFSNREVERRMGLNHGSVSRVFSGHIEAKLELVLGAARAIGLEYDEFFAFAYPDLRPPERESEAARRIRFMLEDLRPLGSRLGRPVPAPAETPPPPPAEPLSRDELLADFKKLLREMMSEGRPSGEDPRKGDGHEGRE
ncbi:MAG TPA: helix-turn-helix transcriptional regulator [Thermoanaerobaculia bacterium]